VQRMEPLTNKFLSDRAAAGNRTSSVKLSGHLQMDGGAVESIECVVRVVDLEFGEPIGNRSSQWGGSVGPGLDPLGGPLEWGQGIIREV